MNAHMADAMSCQYGYLAAVAAACRVLLLALLLLCLRQLTRGGGGMRALEGQELPVFAMGVSQVMGCIIVTGGSEYGAPCHAVLDMQHMRGCL
jgi:hypothetical protein